MERMIVPAGLDSRITVEVYKASSISDLLLARDQVIADQYPDYAAFLKTHSGEVNESEKPFRRKSVPVILSSVRHDPSLETNPGRTIMLCDLTAQVEVKVPSIWTNMLNAYIFRGSEEKIDFRALKEEIWYGDVILESDFFTRGHEDTHRLISCKRKYQQQKVRSDPWWSRYIPSATRAYPAPS